MKIEVKSNLGAFADYWQRAARSLSRDIKFDISNSVPYASAVETGHVSRSGTWVPGAFMMQNALDEAIYDLRYGYGQVMASGADPLAWGNEFINVTKRVSYSTSLRLYNRTPKRTGALADGWNVKVRTQS